MSNVFVSYSRQRKDLTKTLINDIEALGHTVWFDQELSGGQAWWDQILAQVRDCDVFVFALSPEAIKSTACRCEYQYAEKLRKPILPILVAKGVRLKLLPAALVEIQYVDYRKQDRNAALRLARAFTALPPPKPLPDPLPAPPEVPISYLGDLAEQVGTSANLSNEEQSTLVIKLKSALRNPGIADDARALLQGMRKRDDLFAIIAEEIDEFLESKPKTFPLPSDKSVPDGVSTGDVREAVPEGAWVDSETGLMWTIEDNGKDISWHEAMQYAKKLRLGGFTDWRLPTIKELEKLYDPGRGREYYNIRDPFRLSSWWAWSSTKEGSEVRGFYFTFGEGQITFPIDTSYTFRALCVRRSRE